MRNPRLELIWIGKENRPRLEPRILLEDPEKSCHAPHRVTDHDLFDNRLIFGDNLCVTKGRWRESFPFGECWPKIPLASKRNHLYA